MRPEAAEGAGDAADAAEEGRWPAGSRAANDAMMGRGDAAGGWGALKAGESSHTEVAEYDFVVVQEVEVHISALEAMLMAERCRAKHHWLCAPTQEGVAGGLLTLVRNDWCLGGAPTAFVVAPGRILWVKVPASEKGAAVHIIDIHYVGIRAADLWSQVTPTLVWRATTG